MDLVLSLQWVYAAWTANLKLKTTQHCWWLKKERKRNSTNECSNAPAKGRKGIMDVNIFTCIQMYSACLLADSEFWTTQWRQKHGPRTQVCQRKNILAAFWSESPENCNASEHKLQSERSSYSMKREENDEPVCSGWLLLKTSLVGKSDEAPAEHAPWSLTTVPVYIHRIQGCLTSISITMLKHWGQRNLDL